MTRVTYGSFCIAHWLTYTLAAAYVDCIGQQPMDSRKKESDGSFDISQISFDVCRSDNIDNAKTRASQTWHAAWLVTCTLIKLFSISLFLYLFYVFLCHLLKPPLNHVCWAGFVVFILSRKFMSFPFLPSLKLRLLNYFLVVLLFIFATSSVNKDDICLLV